MTDEETKSGMKVSDKRRFRVDESGDVIKRDDAPPEAEAKPAAPTPAADETEAEKFQEECEPCREEWSELPPIDFSSFVFSLSTSTMICLGLLPDPETKKEFRDLPMAKQNIDILSMLQEKTKGNLTKDEDDLLTASLYDLRLRFVVTCRKTPA